MEVDVDADVDVDAVREVHVVREVEVEVEMDVVKYFPSPPPSTPRVGILNPIPWTTPLIPISV